MPLRSLLSTASLAVLLGLAAGACAAPEPSEASEDATGALVGPPSRPAVTEADVAPESLEAVRRVRAAYLAARELPRGQMPPSPDDFFARSFPDTTVYLLRNVPGLPADVYVLEWPLSTATELQGALGTTGRVKAISFHDLLPGTRKMARLGTALWTEEGIGGPPRWFARSRDGNLVEVLRSP